MNAVIVESLAKTFDGIEALKKLSFTVEAASMYGIIGPDGAGKTTFMRIAACLLSQTSGTMSIGGFDTSIYSSQVKKIIGYMPQRFSLYQDLSVGENLTFFADLFGVTKKERKNRIDRLLQFSKLESFISRRAGQLSGGMKQKLALSCTLIHEPDILFLDEPTTGVDPVSRREFWDILEQLKSSGTTIIVSTPYMDEAEMCDRVGLMYNGSLIEEGHPDEFPGKFNNELLTVRGRDIIHRLRNLVFPETVLDTRAFGDRVNLTVKNARVSEPSIQSFLEDNSISDVTVEPVHPTIEDVFVEKMTNER